MCVIDKNGRRLPAPIDSRRTVSAVTVPLNENKESICPARAVRVLRTLGVLLLLLLIIVVPTGVIFGRGTGSTDRIGATNDTEVKITGFKKTLIFTNLSCIYVAELNI